MNQSGPQILQPHPFHLSYGQARQKKADCERPASSLADYGCLCLLYAVLLKKPLLRGDHENLPARTADFGTYRIRMLGGISQSAWFANTFIAGGFNADPLNGQKVF